MTNPPRVRITDRDLDLLGAIDRCPLTVEQLLKLSVAFPQPFRSDSRVRGRLASLRLAGWVKRFQYASTVRGGAPDYYRLTLPGYRLLHGEDAKPETKRAFSEIGIARHHHTRCLSDFIVHTVVSAHRMQLPITDFARENTLRLTIGDESLFPDCSFCMCVPDQAFRFFVELDNGTERIRSKKDADSLERKIRLYERYQDQSRDRFRVLVVSTRSHERNRSILEAARVLASNPQRSLVYVAHLDDYLAAPCAATALCFEDHQGRSKAMIPNPTLPLIEQYSFATATAVC